jgi:cytochrome c551/c552
MAPVGDSLATLGCVSPLAGAAVAQGGTDGQWTASHAVDRTVVGPAFKDVAAKYWGKDEEAALAERVKNGGSGVGGEFPMTPNSHVPDEDLDAIVEWIPFLK